MQSFSTKTQKILFLCYQACHMSDQNLVPIDYFYIYWRSPVSLETFYNLLFYLYAVEVQKILEICGTFFIYPTGPWKTM